MQRATITARAAPARYARTEPVPATATTAKPTISSEPAGVMSDRVRITDPTVVRPRSSRGVYPSWRSRTSPSGTRSVVGDPLVGWAILDPSRSDVRVRVGRGEQGA